LTGQCEIKAKLGYFRVLGFHYQVTESNGVIKAIEVMRTGGPEVLEIAGRCASAAGEASGRESCRGGCQLYRHPPALGH
jgi:hypothetical protein